MTNLTTKELSALEDQLNSEMILVKKYRSFATLTTDAQLKTKYEGIAGQHLTHFNTLYKHLG